MKNFSLKRMAQVMRITFCQNHKWFLNIGIAYLLAHFVGQALVFYTISNSPEAPDWYIAGRMHSATGAFVMISAFLILGGISFTFDVLKDKNNNGKGRDVDVIARAEDAAKIQRIVERFGLTTVDKATVTETVRDIESRHNDNREPGGQPNPNIAKTERGPLSERNSRSTGREGGGAAKQPDRTSVREKLQTYRERIARDRQKDRQTERTKTKSKESRSGKER